MEFNLLLMSTGSVATIKVPILIKKLHQLYNNISIKLVVTKNADFFLKEYAQDLSSEQIFRDADEWEGWQKVGDDIVHIELVKWATMMIIAPLDANSLAKLANGICDNLMTSVCRAWDFTKPILFAPAMNTKMWDHPVTTGHVNTLKSWGYVMIPPISKTLACGDTGVGAMEEVDKIVEILDEYIIMK